MTTPHTPGPWTIGDNPCIIHGRDGEQVADTAGSRNDSPMQN